MKYDDHQRIISIHSVATEKSQHYIEMKNHVFNVSINIPDNQNEFSLYEIMQHLKSDKIFYLNFSSA